MPLSKKDYIKKSCKCDLCKNGDWYSCRRGDDFSNKHRWYLGKKKYGNQLQQLKEWQEEQVYLEEMKNNDEKLDK